VAVYIFLFLPIAVVVVFSFNGTARYVTDWEGLSLKWYQRALADPTVQRALVNSLTIAAINAVLATAFGTMAALGLQRVPKRIRILFDALTYVSVIIPEIVIALATLVLFSAFRDLVNPMLAGFAVVGTRAAHITLGQWSVVAAHVLFNLSLVLLLVRARLAGMDRTLVDASYDLFATPWRTFRQITFPQLLPAIVAGFLLSFTFSFDDYVITSFVSGSTETLPLFVFGQIHQGITPLTNAIAAVMLLVTFTVLIVGQWFLGRRARSTGEGNTPLGILET
jgi:spermidine/putrescine transport system permease protein